LVLALPLLSVWVLYTVFRAIETIEQGEKMNKRFLVCVLAIMAFSPLLSGCFGGEKTPDIEEQLIGSWNRYWNKSYFLLIIRANGSWKSDVRVEGASSKIIGKKGSASGNWRIEENHLVLTVTESNIEDLWVKDQTLFCEIVEINNDLMKLRYPSQRIVTWKRSRVKKKARQDGEPLPPVIKPLPVVVNLNKIRSHDKDRYLCVDLELTLQELMPEQEVPGFHPKAREAAVIFLSSLTYQEVKTFDKVKAVKKQLEVLLTPYFKGQMKDITISHVVIASTMEKVDEFLIEHTPSPEPAKDGSTADQKEEA